ncbi:MAG TPA: hypothetical protein VG676_08825 [Chitinophagaceae bacterium]|jgi:hypothetical protein|nr:hypothetical protein [Chitinophagaceae bacterium]
MKSIKLAYASVLVWVILPASFIASCKTQNEVPKTNQQLLDQVHQSMKIFGDNTSTEYRSYPVNISFFDPVADAANPQLAILKRKEFIKQSGLPDETNIDDFKKKNSISFAFNLYNNFLSQNLQSPYSKTFEQYGAWLILTRLDLLAQSTPDDLQMIYSLTSKLADTKYEGFQLLSYDLNKLYANKFDGEKIKILSNAILQYAQVNDEAIQQNSQPPVASNKTSEKPLPPGMMERLKSYNENKDQNKQIALNKIRELMTKL